MNGTNSARRQSHNIGLVPSITVMFLTTVDSSVFYELNNLFLNSYKNDRSLISLSRKSMVMSSDSKENSRSCKYNKYLY